MSSSVTSTSKDNVSKDTFRGQAANCPIGSSAATAYLTSDVLSRGNLTIAIETMVEKVVFSENGTGERRATSVELSKSPTSPRYCAHATREIILCGGAIASPQLLLLSGIGPADKLQRLGIDVVQDLPAVGKDFTDVCNCITAIRFNADGLCSTSHAVPCQTGSHLGPLQ